MTHINMTKRRPWLRSFSSPLCQASSLALVVLLASSCGRTDFSSRFGDPTENDRDMSTSADFGQRDMSTNTSRDMNTTRPDMPPGPSCQDEVQNGQETGVDCGGPICRSCKDGQGCEVPSDCESGICEDETCKSQMPKKKIGEVCNTSDECELGLCQRVGDKQICTFPCDPQQGTCPQMEQVCYKSFCVPRDFCESASGQGDGPGCMMSSCDKCDENAQCIIEGESDIECVCRDGFTGDGESCQDINECTLPLIPVCGDQGKCTNTPGGYTCSCQSGYEFDGTTCVDINECLSPDPALTCVNARCVNTPGSFECVCDPGFRFDPMQRQCVDINECDEDLITCNPNATCNNTPGSAVCTCKMGYMGDGFNCEDINECDNPMACLPGTSCINLPGAFRCSNCPPGNITDPNGVCVDIDECAEGTDNCDVNATCTNGVDGFSCACNAGFQGDGVTCTPVGMTTLGDVCSNPFIVTTPKGYTATGNTTGAMNDYQRPANACPNGANAQRGAASPDEVYEFTPTETGIYNIKVQDSGFTSAAIVATSCQDIQNTCIGSDTFDPEFPVRLEANTTYFIIVDGARNVTPSQGAYTISVDLDECASNLSNCPMGAQCVDIFGSFACTCPQGTTQQGGACVDIDECANGTNNCDANATCTNTPGSFTCACNMGFTGSGTECWDPSVLGETCQNPFKIPAISAGMPFVVANGSTSDANPDFSYGNRQCPGELAGRGRGSSDEVYEFTPTTSGQYRFDLSGAWNVNLYVRDGCQAMSTCLRAEARFGQGSVSTTVDLVANTTYYIFVDGSNNNSNASGSYVFSGVKL